MRRDQWLRRMWARMGSPSFLGFGPLDFGPLGSSSTRRHRRRPVGLVPWSMPAVVERLEERQLLSCTNPPIADAGDDYTVGVSGHLDLDGSGSSAGGSTSMTLDYAWDIDGDGQYDDASGVDATIAWQVLRYTYGFTAGATYAVGLKVTNGDGCTAADTALLTMEASLPTARITGGPQTISYGGDLSLSGATSEDVDGGNITAYEWDLDGDGDYSDVSPSDISGAKGEFLQLDWDDMLAHSLTFGGTIRLKVTDNEGQQSSTSFAFTVEEPLDHVIAIWFSDNADGTCQCDCGCDVAFKAGEDGSDPQTGLASAFGLAEMTTFAPAWNPGTNPHPVVIVDLALPEGPRPDYYEATMSYGSLSTSTPIQLSLPAAWVGTTDAVSGMFALQLDASSLDTGRQDVSVTLTAFYPDGRTVPVTAGGEDHLVNRIDSEFGNRWGVPALGALQATATGVSLLRGNGTAAYFEENPDGSYATPAGTFSQLTENTDGTFTLRDHWTGGEWLFSSGGLLTEKTDRNGNALAFAYTDADSDGVSDELASVTDSLSGRSATYAYDGSGQISTFTDFAGRAFGFTLAGGLVTQIDGPAAGSQDVVSFEYDSITKLMTKITDPEGRQTGMTWGTDRQLTSITRPGQQTATTYESLESLLLNVIVPDGDIWATKTTATGNVLTRTDRYGYPVLQKNQLGETTETVRNADGQPTQVTIKNASGTTVYTVQSAYDAHGRRTKVTYGDDTSETWTYDANDPFLRSPLSHVDRDGQTTSYSYDSAGNLLSMTLPDPDGAGSLTAPVYGSTYNSAGQVETETDSLGNTTSYSYDTAGQLTSITRPDPDGTGPLSAPVTSYTYDSSGDLKTETDPLGNMTSYTYDAYGRVATVTLPDPDGAGPQTAPVTSSTYNLDGTLDTQTDALGRTTEYEYNTAGRLWKVFRLDANGVNVLGTGVPLVTYTYDQWRVATETDPLGNTTTYAYDDAGRLSSTTVTDALGVNPLGAGVALSSTTYDAAGRVLTETDGEGTVTRYHYDPDTGFLDSIDLRDKNGNNPLGQDATGAERVLTSYTYTTGGQVATETDALGNTTTYAYDNLGRLTSITDPLSRQTFYAYDANSNLTSMTLPDPDGSGSLTAPVTNSTYDNLGRLLTETDPLGNTTSYAYDAAGNLLSVTQPDPDGTGSLTAPVTSYAYDNLGRQTSITDPLGNTTSYVYDAVGQLTSVTEPDPDGTGSLTAPVTSYAYDALGRRTSVIDPLSHTTSYAYDAAGRLTGMTDPLDHTTSYAYDALGRRTSVTQPDPDGAGSLTAPVTSYTYDRTGNVLTETDPLGNTTTYAYDAIGRLTSVTQPDPDGTGSLTAPVTSYGYDALGRRTSVVDPLGNTTSYAYDDVGNLLQVTEPYTGVGPQLATVYDYDNLDRMTSVTDPLSHSTTYAYDAASRLTSETDALSGVTSYGYDNLGRRTSLTDPESNTTTWIYDAAGRMTSETNELNDVRSFVYDNLGRLTKRTDRNGRIREFDYDAASRLTEERWIASDGTTLVDTITRTYDANSQLTSIADGDSSYAYTYDALGRLTQVDNDGTTNMPHVVQGYAYDAAGRRTSADATIGGTADFSNAYTYDNLGRMTRIEQSDGNSSAGLSITDKRVDLTYDALGRFDMISRYEDLTGTDLVATSNYDYDAAGRLTDLDHTQGSTALAFYDWTYDAHSRLTKLVSTDGTVSYSYDNTDQLTAANYDYQTDESYTYDDNGNRTNTGYSTGTNNQLLSDGMHTYEYDDEGNRTKKTTTATGEYVTYEWDHKNHLVAVSFYTSTDTLTKKVEYDYDPNGRRLRKNVDDDGNGTFDRGERYVYDSAGKIDPASGIAIDDLVLLYATGDPTADPAGSLKTRFLHGPAIDQIFADENALGEILWSLGDHQSTIRDLVDYDAATDTTTVANHITYGSFGAIISQTDSSLTPHHAATGQEWDPDAGLIQYNERWLDAYIGWFISEDPSGFDAGQANLHVYAGNSPTNGTDPAGLWTWKLGSEGQVLAISERGDTLQSLIDMGYSESLIMLGNPQARHLDGELAEGISINVTNHFPDTIQFALERQQTMEINTDYIPNPLLEDIPETAKTYGQSGLDFMTPTVIDKETGLPYGNIRGIDLGWGNCYGFVGLFLGAEIPLGVKPHNFEMGPFGNEPVAGYVGNLESGYRLIPIHGVLIGSLRPEDGLIDYLTTGLVKTEDPEFGAVSLFRDNKGLVRHAAIVLGTSQDGKVYMLQKANQNEGYAVSPEDHPKYKQFGVPTYYGKPDC